MFCYLLFFVWLNFHGDYAFCCTRPAKRSMRLCYDYIIVILPFHILLHITVIT